jgi:hypothetical protein
VLCKQQFPICEYQHCAHHSSEPEYADYENTGFYPCCGTSARLFSAVEMPTGCVARKHTVVFDSNGGDTKGEAKGATKRKGEKQGNEAEESKSIDDELTPREQYDLLLKHVDVTTVAFRPILPATAAAGAEFKGSSSTRRRGEDDEASIEQPRSTFAEYSLGATSADDVAVFTYGKLYPFPSLLPNSSSHPTPPHPKAHTHTHTHIRTHAR